MALFGNLFKSRNPFQLPLMPNGGERRAMDEQGTPTDNWYDPLPAQEAKPSKAMQILGVIGDALQASDGGHPTYLPMMLDLQQRTDAERRQLEMYRRKREDDWTDFQRQRDYEVAHPKPANNDTTNDYAFIAEKLGPEAANQYLRNLGDPMVTVPLSNGSVYNGPRSGLGTALSATPTQQPQTRQAPQPGTIDGGYRFMGGDPANQANWQKVGGAASGAGRPFADYPDPTKAPGQMTSGRRTVEGNRIVGGKPNSHHLTGDAADYVGTDIASLRAYFGPNARFLNEGDHIHTTLPGYGRVPYFGRRGTIGAR